MKINYEKLKNLIEGSPEEWKEKSEQRVRVAKLKRFLEWLITPQNEREQEKFKAVVDDYIQLKARIYKLTEEELIAEINNQLKPYKLQLS